MTDEYAKATQEVAKTGGKFAEIVEKVGGFVSRVIGPAGNQVGGILEDRTRYYRYKNLLAIADKVEAIHAQRRLEGKAIPIPARMAIPMLESAALEEDETLQAVWARLIANSTDPNFKEALHPGYIEIAKQLSPDEAIILQDFRTIESYPVLFEEFVESGGGWSERGILASGVVKSFYEAIYATCSKHCERLMLKRRDSLRVYLDNLQRLQLVELGYDFSQSIRGAFRSVPSQGSALASDSAVAQRIRSALARREHLRMTAFGEGFIAACIVDADKK